MIVFGNVWESVALFVLNCYFGTSFVLLYVVWHLLLCIPGGLLLCVLGWHGFDSLLFVGWFNDALISV